MKLISLTQEKFAQVDDWNYDWLNQWNWYAVFNGYTFYAARHPKGENRRILLMHREIMNTPDDMEVDHQDHNGLNCQEYNMRNATHGQNGANRTPYGSSKYLGVNCDKEYGYIRASIKVNGKQKNLGTFKTEEAAAKKYDEAAKLYHGEFANLNFK
jgi:hypothetical protein